MKIKNKIVVVLVLLAMLPTIVFAGIVPNCDNPLDCGLKELGTMLMALISLVIGMGIAFSSIAFVYAGFLYLTSGGDTGKIGKAHEIFKKVIWGFVISLGAMALVQLALKELKLAKNIWELVNSVLK